MKKENIDDVFDSLQGGFDIEEPQEAHKQRFLEKLQAQGRVTRDGTDVNKWSGLYKPLLGIAASILLLVTLYQSFKVQPLERDLASVSPEMAVTQDFFNNVIHTELNHLEKASSPEVQLLIQDALHQIKLLEKDYDTLKMDLIESGDDHRVIYAMITNFQNRINILQQTIDQIETIKQLKNQNHETNATI